ncbi:hypothetical protein AC1031_002201 [Aphanomyces cochlioides]|nr:hypothetical protein AC1031_002201 [Aphanomyces cochlioides]
MWRTCLDKTKSRKSSMDDSWLQDFQFLIATDDQLQEKLAHVCEILNEDSATTLEDWTPLPTSVTTANSAIKATIDECNAVPKEKATKKICHYARPRDEIRRQRIEQLTAT